MGFLDLADEILRGLPADQKPGGAQTLDGHTVSRIVWETDKAVIFQDEAGAFWRYLHAYRQAWPVVVERKANDTREG
jgi:hypothetical protein